MFIWNIGSNNTSINCFNNHSIKKVHEIMKNASGNSWPVSVYPPLPGLIEGTPSGNKYRPGFSAGMMNKDLKLANECAKSVDAETVLNLQRKLCMKLVLQ